MMNTDLAALKGHMLDADATILDALRQLNALSGRGAMTLMVVDGRGRLRGTVTDGDVRRALLAGAKPGDAVAAAMCATPSTVAAPVSGSAATVEALARCRRRGLRLIPAVDAEGRVAGAVDLEVTRTVLPVTAILMAGGLGERLRPLTLTTPKPLLEVDGRPIIDYNVEALARCGITDVTVCTRYLAEQVEAHFSRPVCGISVRTVREDRPLGTLGAASLVDHPAGGTTLVMNSDLLTTVSIEDMYAHHVRGGYGVTIAAIPYTVSVPYAILDADPGDTRVRGMAEKPTYTYYANAGIYLMDNDMVLSRLPRGERTDAPDFIDQAIRRGVAVGYFPINGTWIDIGTPADYRQAQQLVRHARNLSR